MQSLQVNFDETTETIEPIESASPEPWDAVCERFDNDVRRIKTVSDTKGYNTLYACYDEDNQPIFFLVKEDEALATLRQRTFLSKLGRTQT